MSIIASAEPTSHREPVPEGQYTATCVAIIDLGMQYNETYQKSNRKVLLMWELHDESLDIEIDGEKKPRLMSKQYTLSLNEKSRLYQDLNAWRGRNFTEEELKAFDLKNVLGVPCLMQIIHTKKGDKTYSDISSLMRIPKGMNAPNPRMPLVYFDIDTSTPEARIHALKSIKEDLPKLPEWVQKRIQESETARELLEPPIDQAPSGSGDFVEVDGEGDLPF